MARILVADDSATIRGVLRRDLAGLGHEVRAAADGMEALALLSAEPAELVILDVKMPRLDGYEVCRVLREDREDHRTKIVFLTSLASEDDRSWGLSQGADAYLPKPVTSAALAEVIDRLLRPASSS